MSTPPENELTLPYLTALRAGRLSVQRCGSCGYLRWPPGHYCPECLSADASWVAIEQRGWLWSYTTYHHAFAPAWRAEVPYSVGFVETDDGPRFYARFDGEAGALVVGARVRMSIHSVDGDAELRFEVEQ
jgi:uncharacterized protein